MPRIRVIVACSNLITGRLLARLLQTRPQFRVLGSVSNSRNLLNSLERTRADVVLVNADLPGGSYGVFPQLREMSRQYPDLPWVLLVDRSDPPLVLEAFRAGASGVFSCANSNTRLLIKCISRVAEGQIWAEATHLKFLLAAWRGQSLPASSSRGEPLSLLTAREESVVRLVAQGMSNREIAGHLGLSEHTVKNTMFRLFEKLGFSNRVELVLYAIAKLNQAAFPDVGPPSPAVPNENSVQPMANVIPPTERRSSGSSRTCP